MGERRSLTCLLLIAAVLTTGCGRRSAPANGGVLDGAPADGWYPADRALPVVDAPVALDRPCLCKLWIETINGKPVAKLPAGAPIFPLMDVGVRSTCLPDGSVITLEATWLSIAPSAPVIGGRALFKGLKVPPGLTSVTLTPRAPKAPGCASASLTFSIVVLPACVFIIPVHLSTIYGSGPHNVVVRAKNAIGGTMQLRIGSSIIGAPKTIPGPYGNVTFSAVTLGFGSNKLEAEVTVSTSSGALTGTCSATVTAGGSNPSCTLTSPTAKSTIKGDGLGPNQDEDTSIVGLQASFAVATSAGATSVVLEEHKGKQTWTAAVVSGTATFSKINIPDGYREFQATCTDSTTGASGTSAKVTYLVDTAPPPAITDLGCKPVTGTAGVVLCSWTSKQDALGTERYTLRYLKGGTISDGNFATSVKVVPDIIPQPNGALQTRVVSGLTTGSSYTFAVKAVDYLDNVSTISNLPAAVQAP